MYGALKSYTLPFLLAGCPPILCSLIMLLIHRVKDDDVESSEAQKRIQHKTTESGDVNGNDNEAFVVEIVSPSRFRGVLSDINESINYFRGDLLLVIIFLR